MNNKLIDLNNHLFAELERLSDEQLKGDALKEEIDRAKSVSNVAAQIINNASLSLKALTAVSGGLIRDTPKMLDIMTDIEKADGEDF